MTTQVQLGAGVTVGSGVNVGTYGPATFGFTINSSDIIGAGYPINQNTTALGTNGVDGFENTAAETWLGEGYYAYNLSPALVTIISDYVTAQGISPTNSQGYLYSVIWGAGSSISSGIVKLGFYNGNGDTTNAYVDIQAVDTTDPDYLQNNTNNGTSLVGTFLFPATFTIFDPLTDKNGWC